MSSNRWEYVLVAVVAVAVLVWASVARVNILGFDSGIQESGEGFTIGNTAVMTTFGYSDDGDRLRYMVILTWPDTLPPNARLPDPRYDLNSGMRPLVRHADGKMRHVGTDGHVYMFMGDELRTMRVAMNEHTDTIGLSRAASLEDMWKYLQQFRVGD
jgi:hypothetical protein